MDVEGLAHKLTSVLQDVEHGSLTHRLSGMAIDEVLAFPLRDLIDPAEVTGAILEGLGGPGPGIWAERHWEAAMALEKARALESGERLREVLPRSVYDGLKERVERSTGLPKGFGRTIVDPEFMRTLLAEALAETLETFLTRLPFGGFMEGEGGLLGNLARKGAGRLKNAGSALSSLGGGAQAGFKRQAREFAQQSADRLKEEVLERFRAVESHQAVLSMRHRALGCFLDLTLTELYALADDPGWPLLMEWGEATLSHNLQREEVREAIRVQVHGFIERLEGQTLGDWLRESGTLEVVREQGVSGVTRLIGGMAERPEFENWLGDLLSEVIL